MTEDGQKLSEPVLNNVVGGGSSTANKRSTIHTATTHTVLRPAGESIGRRYSEMRAVDTHVALVDPNRMPHSRDPL